MNNIYKVMYSPALGCMIAVSECAKNGGKKTNKGSRVRQTAAQLVMLSGLLSLPLFASELPTGATVVSGSATISSDASALTVNQSSDALITNWQSFSIGTDNSVTFNQPTSTSVALNRVVGQDTSQILGNLNANGQVFLLNPNGIIIGTTGSVQTGAFVASTLNISNEDFLAANYNFSGSEGSIVNNGSLSGAVVALIAPSVSNGENGTITGPISSDVALAAGTNVLLDFDGDGLISIEVQASTVSTLVDNQGLIQADGGLVILSAQGASDVLKGVVNNTGTIQANTIGSENGRIYLLADMANGEINASGTLEANFVETSAATLNIDADLNVNTSGGEWLIDPVNITIDSSKATAIETALGSGDVTVSTEDGVTWAGETNGADTEEGNIIVDASIDWSDNILTLRADNDITINAELTSTGTTSSDGLVLKYAQTTSTGTYNINAPVNLMTGSLFKTKSGSDAAITYTVITDLGESGSTTGTDLQGINGDRDGNYVLGTNIDASDTVSWDGGKGFLSIAAPATGLLTAFTGIFDGLGHTISDLTINRNASYIGLFGYATDATIQNVGLMNVDISAGYIAGGLAGQVVNSSVTNTYVTGNILTTGNSVGGLIGRNNSSMISNSYSTASVSGSDRVGGLVGWNTSTITNSYATGKVSGTTNVGGLVGVNSVGSTVSNSYYDSDTTGQSDTGKGVGISTTEALTEAAYVGFDFNDVWFMVEGSTRPFLQSEYSTSITNTHQLQLMAMDLSADYTLSNNIDFGDTFTDSSRSDMWATSYDSGTDTYTGSGFAPIGDFSTKFTGIFDGLGHTISSLTIDRDATNYVGLFGYTNGSIIQNVGLLNVDIIGSAFVGGLVGYNDSSSISNSYATGSVSGSSDVGGLVGYNYNSSTVSNSYATGSVSGDNRVGGLVGLNGSSSIISNSYATGSVSGDDYVGGLVGSNYTSSTISNSYATGSVSGDGYVGGLVGLNYNSSTISNSYATGSVTGNDDVGGLVGYNSSSTITNSYYDSDTTGQSDTGKGTGLTTAEIQDPFTFIDTGWDFATVWGKSSIDENDGYMMLRWQDASLYDDYVQLSGDTTTTYGQLADVSDITSVYGVDTSNVSINWGGDISATSNVGTYSDTGTNILDVTSTNTGGIYMGDGTASLTINQANITLSVDDITRIYDGTLDATGTANVSSGSLYGTDSLSGGSFSFTDKNAGSDKTVTVADITIDDGNNGDNYMISYTSNTTSTINQATISSITGITATDKTYDGSTTATLDTDSASFTGLVIGDDLTLATASISSAFTDKNAGINKTVNILGLGLSGTDVGNYILADTTASTTADINQATITSVTGITALDKTYDGSTTATLDTKNARFTGIFIGDTLRVTQADGSFSSNRIGTNKTVIISGLTLGGTDAGNYILTNPNITETASIFSISIPPIMPLTESSDELLIFSSSSEILNSTQEMLQLNDINAVDSMTSILFFDEL
ncbi:MAG: filamentous hemagglutinin family protein [Marinomonas primoryensis]|jgi:filamentous hemagglutinin family protein